MLKIVLILIIILIFYLFINVEPVMNTFYFDNDANYQYNLDAVETSKCNTYDCSNETPNNSQQNNSKPNNSKPNNSQSNNSQSNNIKKIDTHQNILLVGGDKDKNPIFKFKDNFYKLNNDTLIQTNIESTDIIYYDYPYKVPTDIKTMKLKVNYTLTNLGAKYKDYKYVGVLNNNYYHQEYILYEKPYEAEDKELEDKLYYYILVKIIGGVYTIMYELPPRNKILPQEYIWASYGPFQIGPLIFN